jgi:hypothetical protein
VPKGYCPTDDPDWHHEHVPTGEIRACAPPGGPATHIRAQAKRNQEMYEASLAVRLAKNGDDPAMVQKTLATFRSNRRLSAHQLHTRYKHGDGIKGDQAHATVSSMQQAGSPDTGARATQDLRQPDLQETHRAPAHPPSGPSRRRGGSSHEGIALMRDPDAWLPDIPPTELPCCEDGKACPQHRQQEKIRHWYRPSRRGDFHDERAA